jgi:hypothetical protein
VPVDVSQVGVDRTRERGEGPHFVLAFRIAPRRNDAHALLEGPLAEESVALQGKA